MCERSSIGIFTLAAALSLSIMGARAFDETKYPNWKGQWVGIGGGPDQPWDPAKPLGTGEGAPLTPEYQGVLAASAKSAAEGGLGLDPTARCVPAGVPRIMMAIQPMEIVITPNLTYFMFEEFSTLRQVYTDGRRFSDYVEPTFTGYSIGEWQDSSGQGRFDSLVFETRAIKGPHTYDASGIPFDEDGEAVITERLYADKADPNILHDDITANDHALTRPWTVTRSYRRDPRNVRPEWRDLVCSQDPAHVQVGTQYYALSPEGLLMPAVRGQKPPDLKYFK